MATRTILVAALLVVSAVAGGAGVGAAQSNPPLDATDGYVVEQGELCQPIEVLESDGTVGSFYDYRNHETHPDTEENLYSSYGTQHLQDDDTSILMLHEGADGTSLVVVHDRLDGQSPGGMVSFDVVGVPPEADWVVRDDAYEGETNMAEWYGGEGWLGASWIWADGRTDGGAINGGLEEEFAVTIQPGFNEHSAFYGDDELHDPTWHGDGRIERWEVLSGDVDDPERTALSLAEPVTIRTGTCDGPSVTYDRTGNGISATVDGFAESDSDSSSTGAVRFHSLVASDVDTADPVAADTDPNGNWPALPDDREPLAALETAQHGPGTVAFSVDPDRLVAAGFGDELETDGSDEANHQPADVSLEANDFVLYEGSGDGWAEVPLEGHTDDDGTLQFEATVSSVDRLAVALEEPPELSAQNETTPEETASEHDNETTHSDIDDTQQGVDADVADALSIPAIAIVGLAVALCCGLLWLRSSRHTE